VRRDREDTVGKLFVLSRRGLPELIKRPLRHLYDWMPQGWRRSSVFRATLKELRASEHWTPSQIENMQLGRLRQLVTHATHYVPAYLQRFAAAGVNRMTLETLRDLEKFPFLTKDDLRRLPGKYRSTNMRDEELEWTVSGGATGAPAGFHHQKGQFNDVMSACRLVSWERTGYRWYDSPAIDLTASLRGAAKRVASQNMLYISVSALDPKRFGECVDAVRAQRPQFLIGFPSTLILFAKLVAAADLKLPVRGIISDSEALYEDQKAILEATFGARIFQWYGLSENAGFAAACEKSERYHFFPTMGIVELIGDKGDPVHREGEEGEIVLTGLTTWATPFIRYRTGDRGAWGPPCCEACRRPFPTLERIRGRVYDQRMPPTQLAA
jgi:phenylacetate-CoA ligase